MNGYTEKKAVIPLQYLMDMAKYFDSVCIKHELESIQKHYGVIFGTQIIVKPHPRWFYPAKDFTCKNIKTKPKLQIVVNILQPDFYYYYYHKPCKPLPSMIDIKGWLYCGY